MSFWPSRKARLCLAACISLSCVAAAQTAPPELKIYSGTDLTACPAGEQLEYFYYWTDIPQLRASSWCGAAQADLDWANATESVTWRIPYLLDACTPGVNWFYSHAFPDGSRYHSPAYAGITMVCRVQPEPPPLGCQAGAGGFAACPLDGGNLSGNGSPGSASPGTPSGGGLGPNAGAPGGEDQGDTGDTGEGGESCRAEAVGNPIFPGTGNKYQREMDYAGPTGLSLVRHYNSSLPGWTHDAAGRVLTQPDPGGLVTTMAYDANGNRLTSIDKLSGDADLDGDDKDADVSTTQVMQMDAGSNRLLGLSRTTTSVQHGRTHTVSSPVVHTLDANGALVNDGLRRYEYDASRRLSRVRTFQQGDEVAVRYLHNALGQRVFKSEPEDLDLRPPERNGGGGFLEWLLGRLQLLFIGAQSSSSLGTAYVYGEGSIPEWALLGEYGNGSAKSRGRTEYLWLPTEDGGAIPVGLYRSGSFYAVHTDHLGSPRLVTGQGGEPVWQWMYSAFGEGEPMGVLKAKSTGKPRAGDKPRLSRTEPGIELNLRFAGQYADEETGLFYNMLRSYNAANGGRYSQADPLRLGGGLNRQAYVGGNPLGFSDPLGLQAYNGQTPPSSVPGGPWTPAGAGQPPGTFYGPKQASGPRTECRYVPDEANGGPRGAKDAYWKAKEPGKPWTRFDQRGNPITAEEAHPGHRQGNGPMSPLGVPGWMPLYPLVCPLCNVMMPLLNEPS